MLVLPAARPRGPHCGLGTTSNPKASCPPGLSAWPDVLVEMEQIGGVVKVLERDQPGIFLRPIGITNPLLAFVADIGEVGAARRERRIASASARVQPM